jgi:hypothetical protein
VTGISDTAAVAPIGAAVLGNSSAVCPTPSTPRLVRDAAVAAAAMSGQQGAALKSDAAG